MSSAFTIRTLMIDERNNQFSMHYLFSPTTTLDHDLNYVDKTYYSSTSNAATTATDTEEQPETTKNETTKPEKQTSSSLLNRTISLVNSISRLDLHNIGLFVLPTQVSLLTKLTLLDLSHNKLVKLPSTMDQLKHLKHLNLSHNNLTHLPTSIYSLTKLTHFDLSFNPFTHICANLARLSSLTLLDLSSTDIHCIPAELLNLHMTTIKLDNCSKLISTQEEGELVQPLQHNPISLIEQCARQLIQPILYDLITTAAAAKKKKKKQQRQFNNLPEHLIHYLSRPKACSSCGGPYFKSSVTRYRIVTREQEGDTFVPVEYKLCSAHWNNEKERILSLFSDLPQYSLPTSSEPCQLKLV